MMIEELMNEQTLEFIHTHANDDPYKLLLSEKKFPQINIRLATEQIIARRKIKDKLPSWYKNKHIFIPSAIAAEQCSSEITAAYKQSLVKGNSVCDLTGGAGVDSYFFSLTADSVTYIERFTDYCNAAEWNFRKLGRENITVINGDCTQIIQEGELPKADTYYIDPARRGDNNKRVFGIEECEPYILDIKKSLMAIGKRLIVKLSPMVDIKHTLKLLPETIEIHINSVRNECKEFLVVMEDTADSQQSKNSNEVRIICNDFTGKKGKQSFTFVIKEEEETIPSYATSIGNYLYEPNASLLKAGAFKRVGEVYGLDKLGVSTHLYTSDTFVIDFPGRVLRILEIINYSKRELKRVRSTYPITNVTTRNFIMGATELSRQLNCKGGGDLFIYGCKLQDVSPILIVGEVVLH